MPDPLLSLLTLLRGDIADVVLRIAMAAVFLHSAQDKLRHRAAAIAEVRAGGLPLPPLLLAATIGVQLAGGLALISPWPPAVALGALILAGFTLTATLLFHRFWLACGEVRQHQLTAFLEHLVMIAGLLLLAAQQSVRT